MGNTCMGMWSMNMVFVEFWCLFIYINTLELRISEHKNGGKPRIRAKTDTYIYTTPICQKENQFWNCCAFSSPIRGAKKHCSGGDFKTFLLDRTNGSFFYCLSSSEYFSNEHFKVNNINSGKNWMTKNSLTRGSVVFQWIDSRAPLKKEQYWSWVSFR